MPKKVLQINLRFNASTEVLEKDFNEVANPISEVLGLKWKIFGISGEEKEATGIYLFEDEDSLKAYINGPIIAALKTKEVFTEMKMRIFDISEEATAKTRGPV